MSIGVPIWSELCAIILRTKVRYFSNSVPEIYMAQRDYKPVPFCVHHCQMSTVLISHLDQHHTGNIDRPIYGLSAHPHIKSLGSLRFWVKFLCFGSIFICIEKLQIFCFLAPANCVCSLPKSPISGLRFTKDYMLLFLITT